MARGWMEFRMQSDGKWIHTGQLSDGYPRALMPDPPQPMQEAPKFFADQLAEFDAGDKPITVWLLKGTDVKIGTLGWAPFKTP